MTTTRTEPKSIPPRNVVGIVCSALVGCLRWHPIADRLIDGVKHRVVWHRVLRIYRVQRFVGQRWCVVSENRVPLYKAIRYGTPLQKCVRCDGTGFVDEGDGDCGPPNYCPDCDGHHSPNSDYRAQAQISKAASK